MRNATTSTHDLRAAGNSDNTTEERKTRIRLLRAFKFSSKRNNNKIKKIRGSEIFIIFNNLT
jgi:hypothetical protein